MLNLKAAQLLLVLGHGGGHLAVPGQLAQQPGAPGHFAAGTSFGLVLSDDDGASWRWVCPEAIGLGNPDLTAVHVSSSGALLAGAFAGLFTSVDRGCTWTPSSTLDAGVSELHSSGAALFAASSRYGATNRVWRSADEGATFAETPIASALELYTAVRSAPSRPQRVYVSAWWFEPVATEYLYVSDDGGDTFERFDLGAAMPRKVDGGYERGSFRVRAVHPTDPDRLWADLLLDDDSRHTLLLESYDRGRHWASRLHLEQPINSMEIEPGGRTLWVGTRDRLWRSTNHGETFEPFEERAPVACVARLGGRTYKCGWPDTDGFAYARDDGSGSWSDFLAWPRVTGAASCPESSRVTRICAPRFDGLILEPHVHARPPENPNADESRGLSCSTGGWALMLPLAGIRRRRPWPFTSGS